VPRYVAGCRYTIALGILHLTWWRDRAWVTLPSNNPYVQLLAGRRRGAVVTVVLDASECGEEYTRGLHNVTVSYVATVTRARRSDGLYWYRVAIPLRVSRMLLPAKDCIRVRVFLEPAPPYERVGGTAR
jgi:hypothetical protein